MDKERREKSSLISSSPSRVEGAGAKPAPKDRDGLVWVREDGAVCVGNECIVIKREPGSKNLDIEVAPTKCGEATADMLLEHILKTVGKGGNTRFTVKSDLVEEQSE
ncbi:hypothetical protein ES708_34291 [subsurface metagenome]